MGVTSSALCLKTTDTFASEEGYVSPLWEWGGGDFISKVACKIDNIGQTDVFSDHTETGPEG